MDEITRDFYEERRRKWRRSAFWRGFFVALLLVGGLIVWGAWGAAGAMRHHVARVEVSGLITDDPERNEMLRNIADSDSVQALVLRINSPGGTAAGAEALYAALREIAAAKPVVAVMSEIATSGGYVAALAADHIVARGNTLTGSIGVIMEYPDLTRVMERFGVELQTIRSSELKAEPSPFRETNPQARALDEALVAESYGWFRGLVAERRGLKGAGLDAVANGAVFTGRLALDKGLIDALGGESEAMAWLESRSEAIAGLPVLDWEVERDEPLLARLLGRAASSGGILGEISLSATPKLYSIGP